MFRFSSLIHVIALLFVAPLLAQEPVTDSAKAADIRSKHIRSIRYYNTDPYSGHILQMEKPFLEHVEEFDTLGRLVKQVEFTLSYVSSLEPGMSETVTYYVYNSSGLLHMQVDSVFVLFQTPSVFARFRLCTTSSYQYDSHAHLLSKIVKSSNGKILERKINTYAKNGNLRKEIHKKLNNPTAKVRYCYNRAGKLSKEEHINPERYEAYYVLHYFYNKNGRLFLTQKKNKSGELIEQREILFDEKGNPSKIKYSDRLNAESIYDYHYNSRTDSLGRKEREYRYTFMLGDTARCTVEWQAFAPEEGLYFHFYVYRNDSTLLQSRYYEASATLAKTPVVADSAVAVMADTAAYVSEMLQNPKVNFIPTEYRGSEAQVGQWLQTKFDSLKVSTFYERNGYLYKTTDTEAGTVLHAYEYYIPPRYPDLYYQEEAGTVYWPNGVKKYESTLKKGTGSIYLYNEQGIKIKESNYTADQKEGWETEWYNNGQLKAKQFYERNVRDGIYMHWDSLGILRRKGNVRWWDLYGLQYEYDEKGRLEYVRYESTSPDQTKEKSAPDTSYTIHYFPDGSMHYKRYGRYENYRIWYYVREDGRILVKEGTGYVDSFRIKDESGTDGIASGSFKNGLRNGLWTTFYSTGKIESKVHYNNEIKSGIGEYYYPDHSRKIIVEYNPSELNRILYYEANGRIYVQNGDGFLDSSVVSQDTMLFSKTELCYPFGIGYCSGHVRKGLPDGEWFVWDGFERKGWFRKGYRIGAWQEEEGTVEYPKNRYFAKRSDYKERKRQKEKSEMRAKRIGRLPVDKMKEMGVEFF